MDPIPLPYLAVARVSGADAGAFLHAQLSADIEALEEGQARFACYCSPRGQVFGLLLIVRTADDYVAVGAASLLPGIIDRLGKYVLRARVDLALAPEQAVAGLADTASAGGHGFSPEGIDLTYGLQRDVEPAAASADRWRALELARGVVWLGLGTTERFIPQMLGFDGIGAVSFTKGCYPGQEIVARAKHLGRVKRRPLLLRAASGPVAPGSSVRLGGSGHSLEGTVVDSAPAALPETGSEGQTLVMVVAPEPSGPVETLEYEGLSYRCATM